MNKLFIHIAAFILILFVQVTFAQSEEKILLNEGIESYDKGEYTIALEKFEKAIDLNSDYTAAYYNAANASYRLGDFEKAKNYYDSYTNLLDNDINKAKALHNLGNVFLKEYEKSPQSEQGIKNLKNSISTYKKALRYNPEDKETRYNLSYALSKLPKENEQNKKDKQDNQDKQDKNDEDKKEDKEQQNQDRKDQQDKRDQENKEKQDHQNKENQENQQDKNNQENQSDSKKSEEQKEKEAQNEQQRRENEQKSQEEQNEQNQDQGNEGDQEGQEDKNSNNGEESNENQDKNEDQNEGNNQNPDDQNNSEEQNNNEQSSKPSNGEQEKEIEGQVTKGQMIKDLDAINSDEQKTLLKLSRQKGKNKQTNSQKDW